MNADVEARLRQQHSKRLIALAVWQQVRCPRCVIEGAPSVDLQIILDQDRDLVKYYVKNASALNKRIITMLIERLKSQVQLLDEPRTL